MAEFCTCGSLIINDNCTNKNCTLKTASKTGTQKGSAGKATSSARKEPKSTRTRRASKMITYNLYDIEEKEEEDAD